MRRWLHNTAASQPESGKAHTNPPTHPIHTHTLTYSPPWCAKNRSGKSYRLSLASSHCATMNVSYFSFSFFFDFFCCYVYFKKLSSVDSSEKKNEYAPGLCHHTIISRITPFWMLNFLHSWCRRTIKRRFLLLIKCCLDAHFLASAPATIPVLFC